MKKISETQLIEKIPYSLESEKSVLGAIFLNSEIMGSVTEKLQVEDFYNHTHKYIFQAMMNLYNSSTEIDYITVENEINKIWNSEDKNYKTTGKLSKENLIKYLLDLSEYNPSAQNIDEYIKIITEKAIARRLIKNCEEIIFESMKDGIDVDDLLNESTKKIFDLSQNRITKDFVGISDAVKMSIDQMNKSYEEGSQYIKTTFIDFDNLIYGFHPSDLIILAARPAMGKTAFALNLATNIAKSGYGVAVISLEMSTYQLVQRLLSSEASIDGSKLKSGKITAEEWSRFAIASNRLANTHMYIDDTPGLNMIELKAKSRRLKNEGKLDFMILDYLQLITSTSKENRQQQISEISRNLKILAKELNIPIIALSQLSRSVEQRPNKRPMLSDLRESGSIEQDADIVMFLYRDDYYKAKEEDFELSSEGLCEVIVAKHRSGPIGSVNLTFFKDYAKFANCEQNYPI